MAVALAPITDDDLAGVASFLEAHMGSAVPAPVWRQSFDLNLVHPHPNHGFLLRADDRGIVGAYTAYYSSRRIDGEFEAFCNLGAWCVLPDYRIHGPRLLRALLKQPDLHFLDLSPSGSVVPMNQRLGFSFLDDRMGVLPALPWPTVRGVVSSDPAVIGTALCGRDLEIYLDHRNAAAARHVLLLSGEEQCYVIFRMDRRKRLPRVFASILHVSNPELFHRMRRALASHLLIRHRALALLIEQRLVGRPPAGAVRIRSPRRKMFRSPTLSADQIDYLYSELVMVPW